MDHIDSREQKWGFVLTILNFSGLNVISNLLLRMMLDIDQTSFKYQATLFVIVLGLSLGLQSALRRQPWKIKVRVSVIIAIMTIVAYILFYVSIKQGWIVR